MGTLERIRKTSPFLLALFAIVFVGFMVASDANIGELINAGSNPKTAPLAVINDQEILLQDFRQETAKRIDAQRKNAQGEEAQVDDVQIRKGLWQELFDQIILEQQSQKSGVYVSDEEMLDIMFENPPDYLKQTFTDSAGNFMKDTYYEIIRNPEIIKQRLPQDMSAMEKEQIVNDYRNYFYEVEQSVRRQQLTDHLRTLVNTSASVLSPTYAKMKYQEENATLNVDFIYFDANSITDTNIKPTVEEVRAYYDKYKSFYTQKPSRRLKYVTFKMQPSDNDTLMAQKKVQLVSKDLSMGTTIEERDSIFTQKMRESRHEVYDWQTANDVDAQKAAYLMRMQQNEVLGPVKLPDGTYFFRLDGKREGGENAVLKASHILFKLEPGRDKDSLKAEAAKVLALAKRGSDFAELARKHSEDPGSGMQGGDLGFFGKGRMVQQFEEAAYKLNVGQISDLVETQFGYHIIKLTDKKTEQIRFSEIIVTPKMSEATRKRIKRRAREFAYKVNEGMSFDTVAVEFDQLPKETSFYEKGRPVLGSQYLSDISFEKEKGSLLEPFTQEEEIIVCLVSDAKSAGIKPFEDVETALTQRLAKNIKIEALKDKAYAAYEKIKNLDSLYKATDIDTSLLVRTSLGMKNSGGVTGVGQDFAFTQKAFMMPVGKISEPFAGEKGYYIMQVTEKNEVPEEVYKTDKYVEYLKTLKSSAKANSFFNWYSKVKDDAKVEDYRSKYYYEY